MCPLRRKVLLLPTGKLFTEQLTFPPDPTGGMEQVQVGPEVCWSETKVISSGRRSFSAAPIALLGPPLVTEIVNVTFEFARTGSVSTVFVTPRSALVPPEMVVTMLALLFSSSGSFWPVTDAVFVYVVPGSASELM